MQGYSIVETLSLSELYGKSLPLSNICEIYFKESKSISITKQKQSYRYKEQTGGGQREGELGKERNQ